MGKRVIRLTESDLIRLVKRVINEDLSSTDATPKNIINCLDQYPNLFDKPEIDLGHVKMLEGGKKINYMRMFKDKVHILNVMGGEKTDGYDYSYRIYDRTNNKTKDNGSISFIKGKPFNCEEFAVDVFNFLNNK